MSFDIQSFTVGPLQSNCYFVIDPISQQTLIIDPGDEGSRLSEEIERQRLQPLAILFTHGHLDHVLGCLELKLNYQLPLYLHPADIFLLERAHSSAAHWYGVEVPPMPPADQKLAGQQSLQIGPFGIQVHHTPGHTPGSVCFEIEDQLFTGDTLFAGGSVGRSDFAYSNRKKLWESVRQIKGVIEEKKITQLRAGHE